MAQKAGLVVEARHTILGGKVQIFRRPRSPHWQCSGSVGGRQYRATTKTEALAQAKDVAEDWYLTLQGKHRYGGGIEPKRKTGKTFREAGEKFLLEYEVITRGERNANYVKGHGQRLAKHLYPFFGDKLLAEVTPGMVLEYRALRMTPQKRVYADGREIEARPSRSTLHHEIVTLRHVLKTANRHGWLAMMPDLSTPYGSSGKIVHRAWFSPDD